MTDWDEWTPGSSTAAQRVRSMGVEGVTETAFVTGVPIDDLSPSQQESVARNLIDALEAGQSVQWLERRVRECFGDRERSYAVANTLMAWVMTQESLNIQRANGLHHWDLLALENACSDCKAIAAKNPHVVGDSTPTPPVHPNCPCCVQPVTGY